MQFRISLLLSQCIIFHNILDFISTTPIVGENIRQARDGEFPAVVAIKIIPNNSSTTKTEDAAACTGTLISQFHVLTVEHCMRDVYRNEVKIIVGSIDLRHGKKYMLLWFLHYNKWAKHKKIKIRYAKNDIAILKMTKAAPSSIRPIEISDVPNEKIYGLYGITAGWGRLNDGTFPQMLQTVPLKILPNSDCENKIESITGNKIPVHHRFICAVGEKFALMQLGDSGSPLLIDNRIVAIQASTTPYPGLEFHPEKLNIQIGISYYREFILNVLTIDCDWS